MPEAAASTSHSLGQLAWLADSPLYIDAERVAGFYDAVVRPERAEDAIVLQMTDERLDKIAGKFNVEGAGKVGGKAEVSPTALLGMLGAVFPFLQAKAEVSAELSAKIAGEVAGEQTNRGQSSRTVTLRPINTPQRQLEHLTLHYLVNLTDRLCLVSDPSSANWREPEFISAVPRALAFLDLPAGVKLIPTAAEFGNGEVVPLFRELLAKNGERPEHYPEPAADKNDATLRAERKAYWSWFDQNFSATRAMEVVETASAAKGGIRWIDFRLPVSAEGDTLHLHITPAGKYDTGVFAYNFIKRGFKHGLRLVGTLKSEPDLNVLAIYDK